MPPSWQLSSDSCIDLTTGLCCVRYLYGSETGLEGSSAGGCHGGGRPRIERAYPNVVPPLLTAFRALASAPDIGEALMTELEQHQDQAEVARQVVAVWYTSQFTRPDKSTDPPADVNQYRSALLWKVIRAHPPAVSAGPYGYWEFI